MRGMKRCAKSDFHIYGAEARRNGLFLLRSGQKILNVGLGACAVFRRHPLPFNNAHRMIRPEGAFLGVNGHHGKRPVVLGGSGFDDHIFIQNGGAEIAGAVARYFFAQKSGRTAVVDDGFFNPGQVLCRGRFGHIFQGQASCFAGGCVYFGKQGNQSAITELRMGMSEFEGSPAGKTAGRSTFGVVGHIENFSPSDRFFPHPNVSAMGLHIAITTGERTRLSVEATRSFPVFYPRLGIS